MNRYYMSLKNIFFYLSLEYKKNRFTKICATILHIRVGTPYFNFLFRNLWMSLEIIS